MSEESKTIVNAIHDLARVMIALSSETPTKAAVIRKLDELGVPPSRIAAILDMETKDVTSVLAKAKKRTTNKDKGKEVANTNE